MVPGAVAKLQGVAIAGARRGGDAEVAPHRQVHSHEADQPGEKGPQEERGRATHLHGTADLGGEVEDRREKEDQRKQCLGLPHEVGPRPLTYGVGHLPHLGGALVGTDHLADQHTSVTEACHCDQQGQDQTDSLGECVLRQGNE